MKNTKKEVVYENIFTTFETVRKANKLTRKKLGLLIGKTGRCIANWESGLHEPSIADVIKLHYIFNVSVDYLIGRID